MILSYDWENNTKVKTPDGRIGRIRVTRRIRKLIDEGKHKTLNVLGDDGLIREFSIDDLEKITYNKGENNEHNY